MKKYITVGFLVLALQSLQISAGEITDTYTTGDTLTAAMLDDIKSAVNDNNTNTLGNTSSISSNAGNISTNTSNISTNTSNISINTTNISDHESRIGGLEASVSGAMARYQNVGTTLSNATVTVSSITITTPDSDGYVIVHFTGTAGINHTNGTTDTIQIALMDSEAVFNYQPSTILLQVASENPTSSVSYFPVSTQRLFPVSANTTYTFYLRAREVSGSGNFASGYMTTLFIPTVVGNLQINNY